MKNLSKEQRISLRADWLLLKEKLGRLEKFLSEEKITLINHPNGIRVLYNNEEYALTDVDGYMDIVPEEVAELPTNMTYYIRRK